MNKTKILLITAFATMTMTACTDQAQRSAEALLEKAETQYENKQYDEALRTIDSLRKSYPKAIEIRKKALQLYQNVALKQAQDDLANTDALLQTAKCEFDSLNTAVERAKASLSATAEMLDDLTLKRMERDSLQVRFDVQCAKIKYIHKKQKE